MIKLDLTHVLAISRGGMTVTFSSLVWEMMALKSTPLFSININTELHFEHKNSLLGCTEKFVAVA